MRKAVLVAAASLLLAGCPENFTLKVTDIDEKFAPEQAEILVSAGQPLTREKLVNQRRTELAYLNDLLDRSKTMTFEPQLKRELSNILSIAVTLKAAFDGGVENNYDRANKIADDEADLQRKKLEFDLARVSKLIEKLDEAELDPKTDAYSGSGGTNGVGQTNVTPPPAGTDPFAELRTAVTALNDTITQLNATMKTQVAGTPNPTAIKGTPEEELRDREAYRDEIKSLIEEVGLDEGHDERGRALHRIQLHLTPKPGTHKNVWGIVRLKIVQDYADAEVGADPDATYVALYRAWLAYVSGRINQDVAHVDPTAQSRLEREIERYATIGTTGGFFDIALLTSGNQTVSLPVPIEWTPVFESINIKAAAPAPDPSNHLLKAETALKAAGLALPESTETEQTKTDRLTNLRGAFNNLALGIAPGHGTLLLDASCMRFADPATATKTVIEIVGAQTIKALEGSFEDGDDDPSVIQGRPAAAFILENAIRTITLSSVVASNLESAGTTRDITAFQRGNEYQTLKSLVSNARRFLVSLASVNANAACAQPLRQPRFADDLKNSVSFLQFREALDQSARELPGIAAYPYSVAPREKGQRISTVATASDAIAIMAAASAVIPQSGVSLSSSFNSSYAATGKVEALERFPRVVAFATVNDYPGNETSEFGWILGPVPVIDPSNDQIRLEQSPKPENVSVDISVPGWWDRVTFEVETFWTGRADGKFDGTTQVKKQRIPVGLHLDSAMFDRLTNMLSNGTLALAPIKPEIFQPGAMDTAVTAMLQCDKSSEFQVTGRGLERATQVSIEGVLLESSHIVPLPDMQGISVKLPPRPDALYEIGRPYQLLVWTYDGPAEGTLTFKNGCAKASVAVAPPGSLVVEPYFTAVWPGLKLFGKVVSWPPPFNSAAHLGLAVEGAHPEIASTAAAWETSTHMITADVIATPLPSLNAPAVVDLYSMWRESDKAPMAEQKLGQVVFYRQIPKVRLVQAPQKRGEPAIFGLPKLFQQAFPQMKEGGSWKIRAQIKGQALEAIASEIKFNGDNMSVLFVSAGGGDLPTDAYELTGFSIDKDDAHPAFEFTSGLEIKVPK